MLRILRKPFYGSISIILAIALSILYYYLTLANMDINNAVDTIGLPYIVASFTLTFIASTLAGISISLMLYRIRYKLTPSTAVGSILPVFTPGCPACTTPLTTILSIIGGLALFPLQGLELKIISVAALTFSIYWTLEHINIK